MPSVGLHHATRRLVVALGPALVAELSGARDPGAVIRWGAPTGPVIPAPAARRIAYAFGLWPSVAAAGREPAKTWFVEPEPLLDGMSPVAAIRADRYTEVTLAADAFAERFRVRAAPAAATTVAP